MSNFKILALEPRAYYMELGIVEELEKKFDVSYGKILFPKNICSYDLVVSCIYHSLASCEICNTARKNNIPVVFFMDGVLQWENMTKNPALKKNGLKQFFSKYHDFVFVVSKGEKEFLDAIGFVAEQYIPKRVCDMSSTNQHQDILSGKDFLLTTASTPCFDSHERDNLIKLIRLTAEELNKQGATWDCRLYDEEILRIVREVEPEVSNITSPAFEDLVSNYEALITTPSSIAVPFFIEEKPVVFFDYRDGPILFQSGWRIGCEFNIERTVKSILVSPEKERITFQLSQVSKAWFPQGELSDKIHQVCVENSCSIDKGGSSVINKDYLVRYIYKSLKDSKKFNWIAKAFKKRR